MSTFERLCTIVERVTGTPLANMTRATTIGDVTEDDFERIELYIECEADLGVELSDSDMEFIGTLGELADAYDQKLQKRARAA